MAQVKRLLINYKTLEEFKQFKEYGIQELSMLEDLESNMIENDSNSPFYGIYFGDKLVARMSLYQVDGSTTTYFNHNHDYLELWKLEVLPGISAKGTAKHLLNSLNRLDCQFGPIRVSNLPVFGIKWALKQSNMIWSAIRVKIHSSGSPHIFKKYR